jgi:hypothetical protein
LDLGVFFSPKPTPVLILYAEPYRFKSIVVDEDCYVLELIRYIHLNLLRAALVTTIESLAQYPWGGHAVFAILFLGWVVVLALRR